MSRHFPNERISCFTAGTVDALNFYGAVPKILKPDNAKTASIKNTKDELILNATYEQLQYYYGVTIVPLRRYVRELSQLLKTAYGSLKASFLMC